MISPNDELMFDDVFLTLKNYIFQNDEETHVVHPESALDLKEKLPTIQAQAVPQKELIEELKSIIDHSVKTIHPLFLNQLNGGFDMAAWTGEVVSSLLNPTMATYEIAPMLTIIEKRVAAELLNMMGFTKGEGIMVTGGSNSNLLSFLCARTNFNPSIRQTGYAHNRFRVYVSAEAHYSFDKAANICGIGTQNLILIPVNDRGEMIPEDLERAIKADMRDGYTPLMVGATCGTTVLGAFDPLEQIARICEDHKLWFHVDAAWGGGALFSSSARHLLKGIELADSVTFDAHKTMGTPLITSYFLTKHEGILKKTNRGGGAEYLFHEYDNSEWDTGTYSLQCGRRADVLKFWMLWRAHGTNGLMARTEHLLDLAKFAVHEVNSNRRFKLIHAHYLNVCFQVHSKDSSENLNSFTLKIREKLVKEGRALVNYAQRADGTLFFRMVFPNHRTQKAHVSEVLKLILEKADEL